MTSRSKWNRWHPGISQLSAKPPGLSPLDTAHTASQRLQLQAQMQHNRRLTLALFEPIDQATFCQQAHGDFSPIGWHLGHIGYTESLWLLEKLAGAPCPAPEYRQLFAADGLPKHERQHLPDKATILAYLADIRSRVETYLAAADLSRDLRLWQFILQHESQHCETIAIVLAQLGQLSAYPAASIAPPTNRMHHIPAGTFLQGDDAPTALDNERPAHWVELPEYWISDPVTAAEYQAFITAGGYDNAQWWSPDGWQWRQAHQINAPEYWSAAIATRHAPVCGVSWYEADAYARFRGYRLPTEAEWERAAQVLKFPSPGTVWEWTDSWFMGYPGFTPFPYRGYSSTYFDGTHRVLRGGSHVTRPWAVRSSFRNWYHPWTRVIFAGFRCVEAAAPAPGAS